MFTGLVEGRAVVIENSGSDQARRLTLSADFQDLDTGESIAVNGVCLTLLKQENRHLNFDISSETLAKTCLAHLKAGDQVNLERAMQAGQRFGGHYVTGHVDRTAFVKKITEEAAFRHVQISGFSHQELPYLIPKGSITVDGVSLTINDCHQDSIELMLIPHTQAVTTLCQLREGALVNIEFDYLTKLIHQQVRLLNRRFEEVEV